MSIEVDIRKKLSTFQLDIHFQSDSRRIGILGASGCGKSMTLKSIAGIETPDEGRIAVENRTLFGQSGDLSSRRQRGNRMPRRRNVNLRPQERNVGYLFQNYALFPTMNVEKNIAAGLKKSKRENEKRVAEMIGKFQLKGLEKRLPGQLSGGQQQRVALARIMAYEPDVILLDEPFSALDMYLKDQLQQELIQMLEDYKGTVIMVSHNRDEVYRFSEELLVIDQGRIVAGGETKKLFEDPVNKEAARLTGCKNFSRAARLDAHTVKLDDWGITIRTERTVPEYTKYIGYRAHDFIPVWGEGGRNMLKFDLKSRAALPFEENYYIRCAGDSAPAGNGQYGTGIPEGEQRRECASDGEGRERTEENVICWFVQRERLGVLKEKGTPDYLMLDEDRILFLE